MNMKQVQTTKITMLAPLDVVSIDYSPVLLLDGHLSSVITDDPEFSSSCEWGFNDYLGNVEGGCGFDTETEVIAFVHREMSEVCPLLGQVPLVTRAGVILGSLSALALVDRSLASAGLEHFMSLMEGVA